MSKDGDIRDIGKTMHNRILRDCGEVCSNTYFEVISPTQMSDDNIQSNLTQ